MILHHFSDTLYNVMKVLTLEIQVFSMHIAISGANYRWQYSTQHMGNMITEHKGPI